MHYLKLASSNQQAPVGDAAIAMVLQYGTDG
jgi:hypothetical protein